ncbi:hypothetical protein LCGC14_0317320 [marine sediment metagenome]|uniref:Uncharacterized protein n=1 Tax=marine sediment metagenome TaxID=412755 RepID=A0A0F9W7J7_9ZZZZ
MVQQERRISMSDASQVQSVKGFSIARDGVSALVLATANSFQHIVLRHVRYSPRS